MTFEEIQEILQRRRLELLKLSRLGAGSASLEDILDLYEVIGEMLEELQAKSE